jgi:hypothetical protein
MEKHELAAGVQLYMAKRKKAVQYILNTGRCPICDCPYDGGHTCDAPPIYAHLCMEPKILRRYALPQTKPKPKEPGIPLCPAPLVFAEVPYSALEPNTQAQRSIWRKQAAGLYREWPKCKRSGRDWEVETHVRGEFLGRRGAIIGSFGCVHCHLEWAGT